MLGTWARIHLGDFKGEIGNFALLGWSLTLPNPRWLRGGAGQTPEVQLLGEKRDLRAGDLSLLANPNLRSLSAPKESFLSQLEKLFLCLLWLPGLSQRFPPGFLGFFWFFFQSISGMENISCQTCSPGACGELCSRCSLMGSDCRQRGSMCPNPISEASPRRTSLLMALAGVGHVCQLQELSLGLIRGANARLKPLRWKRAGDLWPLFHLPVKKVAQTFKHQWQ